MVTAISFWKCTLCMFLSALWFFVSFTPTHTHTHNSPFSLSLSLLLSLSLSQFLFLSLTPSIAHSNTSWICNVTESKSSAKLAVMLQIAEGLHRNWRKGVSNLYTIIRHGYLSTISNILFLLINKKNYKVFCFIKV